jgi:hypothetical protein
MNSHRAGGPGPKTLLSLGIVLAGITAGGCSVPAAPTGVSPTSMTSPVAAGPATPSTSDRQDGGPASAPPAVPQPTGQTDRCHTSMLAASFENLDAGAGQRSVSLALRNVSSQSCSVFGYPGMQLQEADGRLVPTTVIRNAGPVPQQITLAPGASAASTLAWTVINGAGEPNQPCEPTADHAEVTPPDERDPLMVAWTMGPVCEQGAIRAGSFHQ